MTTAIIVYIVSICITICKKYFDVLEPWKKPIIYQKPILSLLFMIIHTLLIAIYTILFYSHSGLYFVLGAFALHFIIASIFLRIFFNRQVAIWYPDMLDVVRSDQQEEKAEDEIRDEAYKLAVACVKKALKNEY